LKNTLAHRALILLDEAASESPGRGKRGDVALPIVDVIPAEDQSEGHERTDDGAAGFAPEGDARKRSQGLEDGPSLKVELLLEDEERRLCAVAAAGKGVSSRLSEPIGPRSS
jgi:hypothetical protein